MPVSLPSEEESRRRRQAGEEEGEVLFLFHFADHLNVSYYIEQLRRVFAINCCSLLFHCAHHLDVSYYIEQLRCTQRLLSGAAGRPFPRTRVRGLASSEGEQQFPL